MIEPYDNYEQNPELKPEFTTDHVIASLPDNNRREFYLTFGQYFPSNEKLRTVARLIITKHHMLELFHDLGNQLKKFEKDQ